MFRTPPGCGWGRQQVAPSGAGPRLGDRDPLLAVVGERSVQLTAVPRFVRRLDRSRRDVQESMTSRTKRRPFRVEVPEMDADRSISSLAANRRERICPSAPVDPRQIPVALRADDAPRLALGTRSAHERLALRWRRFVPG